MFNLTYSSRILFLMVELIHEGKNSWESSSLSVIRKQRKPALKGTSLLKLQTPPLVTYFYQQGHISYSSPVTDWVLSIQMPKTCGWHGPFFNRIWQWKMLNKYSLNIITVLRKVMKSDTWWSECIYRKSRPCQKNVTEVNRLPEKLKPSFNYQMNRDLSGIPSATTAFMVINLRVYTTHKENLKHIIDAGI